jgi:arylsulfatase A-like enzyme
VTDRPNIVLVYTDQQRHDTIGALGNGTIRTPHLDRLVAEGVAFTHATTPSPVCMPARWSLHSGQWTSTHRCYSNHHPGLRPAADLPGILRTAGYRVGLSGKNHSFLRASEFDFWEERPRPRDGSAWQVRQSWVDEVQRERYPRLAEEPVPGGVAADPARAKTDAALRFVDTVAGDRDDDRPFFLWLSYVHPHTPYMAAEPYYSMYRNAPIPEPVVEPEGLRAAGKPFRQVYHQRNNDAILPSSPEQVRKMRQVYYGQVSLVDAEIGRLLDHLDQRGLAENTLIVFTSDHGDYMGDHGMMTKSPSLYDCLVRVPLIVRWPGHVDKNRQDARFASHVDLLPTFAAAAGAPRPEQAQGMDLLPFLRDGGTGGDMRSAALSEYGLPGLPYNEERISMSTGFDRIRFVNPLNDRLPWEGNPVSLAGRIRMIRTHEYKYVEELEGTCELYDLVHDPHELVNLWNQPAYVAVQRELETRMRAWKQALPGIDAGG